MTDLQVLAESFLLFQNKSLSFYDLMETVRLYYPKSLKITLNLSAINRVTKPMWESNFKILKMILDINHRGRVRFVMKNSQ